MVFRCFHALRHLFAFTILVVGNQVPWWVLERNRHPLKAVQSPVVALFAADVAHALLDGTVASGVVSAHKDPEMGGHIGAVLPALAPHFWQSWRHSKTPASIVDIGANVGDFTSAALHHFTALPQRRNMRKEGEISLDFASHSLVNVLLVEPSSTTAVALRGRVTREHWDLVANVSVLQAAVAPYCNGSWGVFGDPDGQFGSLAFRGAPLLQSDADINSSMLGDRLLEKALCVDPVSLQSWVPQQNVFFLKLDCEGCDIAFLQAASKRGFLRRVRFLGFELSEQPYYASSGPERVGRLPSRCLSGLRRDGFACFLVHGSGLLPLFGGVMERVNWLLSSLPVPAFTQWVSHPNLISINSMGFGRHVKGDVFCGQGCDEAILDIVKLMVGRRYVHGTLETPIDIPILVAELVEQEFQCVVRNKASRHAYEENQAQIAEMLLAELLQEPDGWMQQQLKMAKATEIARSLIFQDPNRSTGPARALGTRLLMANSWFDPWASLLWGTFGWLPRYDERPTARHVGARREFA